MKNALIIALSIFSVSAFAAHTATTSVSTEQAIKGVATGAISFGMSAKQIQKAIK
ncbi:hypothetical protein H2O73_03630 [Vibrio sp. 404]|uniref:Uncharacterized protein n=1 Tax=Vibrio marinisediminis TaxID=2758441 RepID=A0A7W2FNM7_9VIBR|nr:hypothetical protein [Vibrio marinisediminis]MBA5761426.1 hypothetical protein [Vibrio marinisediminis]